MPIHLYNVQRCFHNSMAEWSHITDMWSVTWIIHARSGLAYRITKPNGMPEHLNSGHYCAKFRMPILGDFGMCVPLSSNAYP